MRLQAHSQCLIYAEPLGLHSFFDQKSLTLEERKAYNKEYDKAYRLKNNDAILAKRHARDQKRVEEEALLVLAKMKTNTVVDKK